MALSEFVAMETAYVALQQLDPAARQRAMHWLTDALTVSGQLPKIPTPTTVPTEAISAVVSEPSREAKPRRRPRGSGQARRGKTIVASDSGERAYRRMPDADTVLAAYQEVGSVSGLADHFGVPRHTVQGWARRLRREGYDIGRSA